MSEKYLEFIEPHPTGGTSFVRLTEDQVIRFMQEKYPELSEEAALDEFIVINWAYYPKNDAEKEVDRLRRIISYHLQNLDLLWYALKTDLEEDLENADT